MLHSNDVECKCVTVITADGTLHPDASLTISHTLQIHINQVSLEFSRCDCFTAMPSTNKGTLHRVSSQTAFVYLPALDQCTFHCLQSFFNPLFSHLCSLQSTSYSQLECVYWIETLLIDTKGRPKRKLGRPRKSSLGIGDLCLDLPSTSTQGRTNQKSSTNTASSSKSRPIKFIEDSTAESDTPNLNEPFNDANLTEEKERQCLTCNRRHTPLWRRGPQGTGTLCNACGVKWNKQLKQQYTGNTCSNDNMNSAMDRRHSVVSSNNGPEDEHQEHHKNVGVHGRGPSVASEVETVPVFGSSTIGDQAISQRPKVTNFMAPLKKRKVILD